MGRISQIDDCDLDEERPPTVLEIIASVNGLGAREIVQELWGAGYTITKRRSGDPFEFDRKIIPVGMTYEWRARSVMGRTTQREIEGMTEDGWRYVPSSRHDGLFMPAGYADIIDIGGQILMERPEECAERVHADRIAKAHKNVDDWVHKYGGQFSGGVRVWTGDSGAPPAEFCRVGDENVAATVIAQSPTIAAPRREPVAPAPDIKPVSAARPRQSWLRRLLNVFMEK